MKLTLAIFLGKIIFYLTKALKIGGGSAAPGYYALKLEPDLVKILSAQIPLNVVIAGTNGKTTTARMLAHFAKYQRLKVIKNATGSNLERGISSSLIQEANLLGKIKGVDLGIWELDEAALGLVIFSLKPKAVVFLNVLRDQLDRYGEVDNIIKRWSQALKKIPAQTQILINGDDQNLNLLKKVYPGKIRTFGLATKKIKGEKVIQPAPPVKLNLEAVNIKTEGLKQSTFQITDGNEKLAINLPLAGIYNIYNFLAAFGLGKSLGFKTASMIKSLAHFTPAFGRVEKLEIKGKKAWIFLIKNPVGASLVFQTVRDNLSKKDGILIALNDNFADGQDVSWIWDAEFEQLSITRPSFGGNNEQFTIIVSGTRAEDLAVRLKYAGFNPDNIIIESKLKKAFKKALDIFEGQLFILPTYTALLSLQKILTETGVKSHYWEEDL